MEPFSRSNSIEANALSVKKKQKRKAAADSNVMTEEAVKKLKLCV